MRVAAFAVMLLTSVAASAQSGATAPDARPATVRIVKTGSGALLADRHGRTLYGLNMRVANGRSGASLTYCTGPCQDVWAPLPAPADAPPIGDWKVLVGAQGPQWAYRNNLVFTFKADRSAGAVGGDGYDDLWMVLRHVPSSPAIQAPAVVTTRYDEGRFVFSDGAGHALFTARAACTASCAKWTPLEAGMAARPIGQWSVLRQDGRRQWAYRGKPVFVADGETASIPATAVQLQP